ncbi:efflux RND transporter periplasmic adaptor subunit [Pacificoceanicola onchidii]|uniref:efflux RND transporter periplasmic adaptor subunit n=1 Tax=Pacificoceanicola onchidii TaxID=2562685 RepID=UPI0010A66B5F|nr:HlyD family efflux transporter periplasmic adaptor subunit [Pacificoceanicola onchidii]
MARNKKRSRILLSGAVVVLVGAALAAAFWPRPVLVDLGTVSRGPMQVTIDEVGRTRVSEPYVVSTPVAGRLQRVQVRPGDTVVKGETIVAHMLPTNPVALDLRTRGQALAAVQAAEAALRVSQADHNAAIAGFDLARAERDRAQLLADREIASAADLERRQQAFRVAAATVQTTEAAIAMREADLANARAQLLDFDDEGGNGDAAAEADRDIPLHAPADGRVLRVVQQSETTLPSGAPIMEIGNVETDLEVVVELISSDAVGVKAGDLVSLTNWGGPATLTGEVSRIDPLAITKYSALGVEEQRVPVTVTLTGPVQDREALGHGYRVETHIIVWQSQDVLRVPASALFRHGPDWAVFAEDEGRASLRLVQIGRTNGIEAEVVRGLKDGDRVVLYPSAAITDGSGIASRIAQ